MSQPYSNTSVIHVNDENIYVVLLEEGSACVIWPDCVHNSPGFYQHKVLRAIGLSESGRVVGFILITTIC